MLSAISSDSLAGMPSPRIEVPSEIVQKWQEIVNLLAEIIHVPAALVMKLEPPNIKVFVSSESSGNPYEKDEVACFDPGLYCERVIRSQQQLLVPDALQDEEWKSNPDVKLGMISYLGFPIAWPDGHIFGTVCVLDDKRNAYTEPYRKFLLQCRDLLQTDLRLLTSAMREGEERFRLVANAAPVLIWMSGPDKLCNYFNQPWIEFTGRPIELELGNGWAEGVHPEDLERTWDTYTKAFDGRESFKVEYRLRRHDREYRWVLDTAVPRFNRDGSFAGYIGSCIDITERKRAEEVVLEVNRALEAQAAVLQSREELLKIFVKNVPAGVAMVDREMRYLQVSDRWCADYSVDSSEVIGRSHYELFPNIPPRWKEMHSRALAGETLRADEDRWDHEGGTTWVRWEIRPWKTATGTIGGILIFAEDITQRRQLEEALLDVSRKLIQSEEQERARIGRELHDDINQRLAMLALELGQLEENPSEVRRRMHELQKRTTEISDDVQALSHELHSSKLEYLGVVAGMRSWCREFGERQRIEVNFKADVATRIPSEIGVTLFRISQEALHNAVKHSGVRRIEVQLSEHSNEIHLTISDAGKGFDIETVRRGRGLGLASMEERVRLVNGTIAIDSKPLGGTSIRVSIPVQQEQASERAAG